jgi:redox-sensitive bicupin YhaK (pirin superfamily)
MRRTLHRATERGFVDYGGVCSYHSFPFGDFEKEGLSPFGALSVLNDDFLRPGGGVGAHPHSNQEMLWLVMEGELTHCDDLGNHVTLQAGDAQVVSAGSGIWHAERNRGIQPTRVLQIWMQPNRDNSLPRYQKQTFETPWNQWQLIAAPLGEKQKALGWHQDAWLSRVQLMPGATTDYQRRALNTSLYLFVLEGEIAVAGEVLARRDAMGFDAAQTSVQALTVSDTLLFEVPGVKWQSGASSAPQKRGGNHAELTKQLGGFGWDRAESGCQLQ